ncbi:family 16 glycosylhydrolase [Phenylobacterium montanum]|uniref:Family 16 glycosylhydrolase n=1 Tax=Phenylobacterium montanum TaxID=2823693 RepID=A0A975FZP9_9CAUL|nr:family 16 glycosylhydrolase [Caulobacter sp. S6]QUD87807.1 family 16 glycosylhydrolase [Caulobacter sp. S6]
MASGYYDYDGVWLAASATPTTKIWGVGVNTITAGSAATELYGSGQGTKMVGGTADDIFWQDNLNDQIIAGTSGVDTVIATLNYVLPAGIQNLTLNGTYENVVGIGNAMANIITADKAGETVMGGGGDDVIISAGGDTFLYAPGAAKDIIYNFHTGGANGDVVRLTGYSFNYFAEVQAAMTQVGSDVVLKLSSTDLIDFKNTTIGQFTAANFQLAVDTNQMTMTFDDEFNSFSEWNPATGAGTWRTYYAWGGPNSESSHLIPNAQELGINVSSSFTGSGTTALGLNPFSVSNGVLTITGAKTPTADLGALWNYQYTTGVITTQPHFAQTYGYFETRVEFPSTPVGLWPAFWLLPASGGGDNEIDVFEMVNDQPNTVHETVHWDTSTGAKTYTSFSTYVPNLLQGFHTYGVLWTASTITWFIDGAAVGSLATPAGMNTPMYMITNLSVGGNWPGAPDSTTQFPAKYQIDYIRAYSLGTSAQSFTASASGGDTFYVHNSGDIISVPAGTPNESVVADVSYALPANIQNITVSGSGLTATANGMGDHLTSTGGANTLVGGAGIDTFYVNNTGDKVVVAAGQTADVIISSVSYALSGDLHILRLTTAGLTATGNAAGHNYLTSLSGGDTLIGGAGGYDVFTVTNSTDVVQVAAGTPGETVRAYGSFTLGANIQNLVAAGGAVMTLTGNSMDNVIAAGKGADTLTGGGGNDIFVFAPGDKVETVTDFNATTAHDQIDISAYQSAGITETFVDHGTYSTINFSNGDVITLDGVHASSLSISGHYII